MASEDLLQLLTRAEAVDLKQAEVMHLVTVATVESLASGEIVPGDPEFAATAARGEAMALEVIRSAAESVAMFARKAAEYAAAAPEDDGGEAVADAMRRQAASAAALASLAEKFAAFMRRAAALPLPAAGVHSESDSDSSSDVPARPATARPRRRNARYFGPEWSN
ncbi:unnamed protein product [Urochloa decumbens]|uniref:Uncharacterized protein n=1 Tax=Urochloa decumbens TaxID=240449 RepID=A0ABC9BWD5_9POAL